MKFLVAAAEAQSGAGAGS